MALPKRRQSNMRTRKRRTHYKITAPNVVECPHCHNPKLPHRVCLNCGYYGKKQVLNIKEKE